jgi:hypothetical protein
VKEKEFNSPIKPSNLPKKKPQNQGGIGLSIAASRDREQGRASSKRQLAEDEMNLFALLDGANADDSKSANKSGEGPPTKNKDGVASEVDSTVMGGGDFNLNMSQPIEFNK